MSTYGKISACIGSGILIFAKQIFVRCLPYAQGSNALLHGKDRWARCQRPDTLLGLLSLCDTVLLSILQIARHSPLVAFLGSDSLWGKVFPSLWSVMWIPILLRVLFGSKVST